MILKKILFAIRAFLISFSITFMATVFPKKWKTNREDRMKKNGRENDDEGVMTAGWIMLKSAFLILYKQSFHINVGDDIPSNIELTDVDSASKISLQEMCSTNVPLIINFGSCT